MPVPIICLDEDVRHFAERVQQLFSKPQCQSLVTVLLGLMLCEGTRTLSGVVRQIADGPSLAGLSRLLSEAPWKAHAVEDQWLKHFRKRCSRRWQPNSSDSACCAPSVEAVLSNPW